MGYAILIFLTCFLLVAGALVALFDRKAFGRRLTAVLAPHGAASSEFRPRRLVESLGNLAHSIQRIIPRSQEEISTVQQRLVRAGIRDRNAVSVLYAAKAVAPVALCVAVTATGLYSWSPFAIFGVSAVIGYLAPDFVLDRMIRSREDQIRRSLPDVLDLLVVCLEAGLSLDQAVIRAVEEMRPSYPAIIDEFGLVMLEVRAGRPRAAAWRSLGERSDVEFIHLLVSILIQADQFGTGVSKTLRAHSETIRTRRTQQIEEQAAKTTVKLLFPLVFFMFPSLLVVTLGPAFIIIAEGLKL